MLLEGLNIKEIKISRPMISDEEIHGMIEVLKTGYLAHGKIVEEFEKKFAEKHGCREGIAVVNGTAALEISLRSLGIGFGDEVIVPAFTFIATATSALSLGARPVLCDIDPDIFTIDPKCVEEMINRRTKVIIPVHLFGHPADMDPIMRLARENEIYVLEDAAQAHGSKYKDVSVGCIGDIGIFSMYATKNITTGEGGMILTNDMEKARFIRIFRDQGQVGKYHHEILGLNYRMTSLQGILGLKQLEKLDLFNEIRRRNALKLTERLRKIDWLRPPVEKEWGYHVYHQYVILLKDDAPITRDGLREYLRRNGVETAVHYPTPINRQPLFKKLGYAEDCCPVSDYVSKRILSLPVHPGLTDEDIDYIAELISRI